MFFADACGLLAGDPPSSTVTHLVAHLLREVESAVRAVLQPAGGSGKGSGADKHRVSILAVLDELGIPHDDPTAEFWLGMTGQDNPNGLAIRAHRLALEAPRPADNAFTDLVNGFEELLDRLLQRFEARYMSVFSRLDELLRVTGPAAAHVTQLRNNFPQNQAALGYFFARADAAWVTPLAEGGYFSSPPEPVLHDEEGTVELPFWPQSRFLVRVASSAAAGAVDAALMITATDNSRVTSDLAELCVQVPADQSVRLLPRIIASLSSRFGVLIPERIGRLCRHLADDGQSGAAMELAEVLLGTVPDYTGSRGAADSWSYAEILREDMPAVTRTAGLPALALLARNLDQAITARTPTGLPELRQDLSVTWMPALGGRPAGSETDPATALVTAVRDAATQLLDAGDAAVGDVVAELESHDWPVFRRLALFVLCSDGHGAADLIGAHMTDPAAIRDFNLNREFLALARRYCGSISQDDQQGLLALIGQGPEIDEWARRYEKSFGEPPTVAVIRDRVSRWQRDRLAAVQAILSPDWQVRYQGLVEEFGEAPDPASAPPMAVRDISFTGPVTAGELMAAPIGDVIDLLRTWEPPPNQLGPSRFSVASALGDAVQQDAARWSAEADAFIGLPAVYVAAVISGLWRAARGGTVLDWDAAVRLCAWADEQAVAELAAATGLSGAQWRDARLNTLRLLEAGFRSSDSEAPITGQDQAWTIIKNAALDPDPLPQDEARWYESGQGPGDVAINHTRPQALITAVACALWARRNEADADLAQFREILDHHLDPQREPSLAVRWVSVRWVYGAYFPQLAWLDRSWTVEHAAAVFPADPAESRLWAAAWDAYITYAPVAADAWGILDDRYQMAVERLDPGATERPELARAYHLGRHLLTRYWSGQLTLDSHDQMLRRFYLNAPVPVRVDLMRFLGRSIRDTDPLDAAVAERLIDFWEARLQAVQDGADPSELPEFGDWFASGKLGDEWELQQLLPALRLAGRIESVHVVLRRLASLAATRTATCLEILQAWVQTRPDPFNLQLNEQSIRAILKVGLDRSDQAMTDAVTTVVSLCIADGFDLRDIFGNSQ